jgi:2,4-dienoyl-CoA reductase-like NADH-dependent reductase (Old Yellow Enzyme family)
VSAADIGLFAPLRLRSLALPNRLAVSPMCMYSSQDGLAQAWHLTHLGSRAVGGAGLVFVEMTDVTPDGRITPGCMGIWSDAHAQALRPIVDFCHAAGASIGIQLAHAGRKASCHRPWEGGGPLVPADGGWTTVGPSALPFRADWPTPHALSRSEIRGLVEAYAEGARRARDSGFDLIELHGAHGYLLHQFLSPLSNKRRDAYGGSRANRMRFTLEVVEAVRAVFPAHLPVALRLSCTDWVAGGWHLDDSVVLARELRALGLDLVDCSSGGVVPARVPDRPGVHVPLAARIRADAGIATAVVGRITRPHQADAIVRRGEADLVLVGREFLRDAYLATHWAAALGTTVPAPRQYLRAWPAPSAAGTA